MRKLIVALTSSLVLACAPESKKSSELSKFIPQNSAAILKLNKLESLKAELRNNELIKKTASTNFRITLEKDLDFINLLDLEQKALLCITEVGRKNFEYTLITKHSSALLSTLPEDIKVQSSTYQGVNINELQLSEHSFFSTTLDSVLVGSTSKLLIENAIRQQDQKGFKTAKGFDKAYQVTNDQKTMSVITHPKYMTPLLENLLPGAQTDHLNDLCDWVSLDATITNDQINLNGIAISNDSLSRKINLFKGLKPKPSIAPSITPINAVGFAAVPYDDFTVYLGNVKKSFPLSIAADNENVTAFLEQTDEVFRIYGDTHHVTGFHTLDITEIDAIMPEGSTKVADFRQNEIYQLENSKALFDPFKAFFKKTAAPYYITLEDYVIFADTIPALENIIANKQNGTVLESSSSFQEMSANLSDASSLIIASTNAALKKTLQTQVDKDYEKDVKELRFGDYKHAAVQLVNEGGFAHVNAIIGKSKSKTRSAAVSQEISVTLDTDLATEPFMAYNHRSKEKDIAVQDIDNNLYLISNRGKIFWKKKLSGRIIGDIHQVDLYKNGRWQLAFVLSDGLYVVDRNGRDVAPFPIKTNSSITQGLALFDYDKNKSYRFFVTKNDKLTVYNSEGKEVTGFTFNDAKNTIVFPPKHIRLGSKDYIIVVESDGAINILSRTGAKRVNAGGKIKLSGNDIYGYQNSFTTTDADGNLIQVDQKGKRSSANLKLAENHFLSTTSKTMVTLSDNILKIKGNTYELDFGVYTAPKIFYIKNKIYVAVTDLQTKKVYLFDSNAKLLPNFPVYGSSAIDLEDIDNDKKLEFVVKGEKSSLLVYKMN